MNVTYRVSAFIDVVNDGSHENGEPIASWEGNLTKNVFNANLVLLDAPPTLVLEGTTSVTAERGETFALAVKANDFPDSNWTFGDTLSSPMNISVASSTTGIIDVNDSSGQATVKNDASYGSYQLTFNATDAAGNQATPLVRELNITDLNPVSYTHLTLPTIE